ncbi:hypothetical protein [Actinomadura madurae]|uniref:hypothetical protein n=1 Tax=Actinomadura madurae TaxID=1993 RepID=UPI00202733A4|nr:hypothetical protein [Actinomadura madurae]MCP9955251.1 hypothetical protein [Actinomadura madurae]MCP9971986.1 hypothetical protein [Actinomadura madurae]MCP9984489.1 hypothetical protein [Actinomadura madurae]MCQ0003956.1 hypothetical protein [Actinomadura madurae]MCQ0020683.1 hypothetical protein [Actinomadura madurae]
MSELQIVQPNTWTPLLGTDVEVLVADVADDVRVEAEMYRNDRGEQLVEFSLTTDSATRIVLRAPSTAPAWPDD